MSDAAQDHERITVVLIPDVAGALARLVRRTRRSKTDLVNRAVTLYEFTDQQVSAGGTVMIRAADGTLSEVRFL